MDKDNIKEKAESDIKTKVAEKKPISMPILIISMIVVILGMFDATNFIDFHIFHGAFTLLTLFVVLQYVLYFLSTKYNFKCISFAKKVLTIAVVLELTVFQLPSFYLLGGNYNKTYISAASANITGSKTTKDDDTGYITVKSTKASYIRFSSLNIPVRTMKIEYEPGKDTHGTYFDIDFSDSTHSQMRTGNASGRLAYNSEDSKYVVCDFSGDVGDIAIRIQNAYESDSITIKRIILNETIPYDIVYTRVLLITLLSVIIYVLLKSKTMSCLYKDKRKLCGILVGITTTAAIVFSLFIINFKFPNGSVFSNFTLKEGDEITQELVDMFENKQVSLLKEPTQELLDLENPFDQGYRDSTEIEYEWDHLLYDGKYYSYYGIGPVLLIFLPYHLITGYYFSTDIAVLMFTILGLIFLSLIYLQLIKRRFKDIPVSCVVAGHMILLLSCGIWYSMARCEFYEIATSAAFAFITIATFLLIKSNVMSKDPIKIKFILLSSIFYGIAVLSRPTTALYVICAVIVYVINLKHSGITEGSEKLNRKRQVLYTISAAAPLVILGIVQITYNYLRFGSIVDFGIEYSLTINDFINAQCHPVFMLIGVYNYFFAMPYVTFNYPFVQATYSGLGANGYYFVDGSVTAGLFFAALPNFSYCFAGKALKKIPDKKNRIKYAILFGLPCIIIPLYLMALVWESGYSKRYFSDFSWQFLIGAYMILFYLYQKSKNQTKKELVSKFMAICVPIAFVINGILIFNYTFKQEEFPEMAYYLERFIMFWK